MAKNQTVITLDEIYKAFGSVVAVDNINLSVNEGEFFSLLGPSGCGKTTTLRIISGLESPTSGSVTLFGEDVTDTPPQERETNLVFQNLALFPHMTVEENLRFGLRHEDISEEEVSNRITETLRVVDMSDYEDRSVTQLSGGQQQRIALARSLAKQPAVLLLDEPLASLDRKLRQRMQFELRDIQKNLGTTFFYVTHDQEVAMTMSDRMAIMRDGDIIQLGAPEDIYEDPKNSFVADFIGDANLIDGEIIANGDGSSTFESEDGSIRVPTSNTKTGGAQIVFRPENLTIGRTASNKTYTFDANVTDRRHQGRTINFTAVLDNDIELEITQKNRDVRIGDRVAIGFDRDDYSVVTN